MSKAPRAFIITTKYSKIKKNPTKPKTKNTPQNFPDIKHFRIQLILLHLTIIKLLHFFFFPSKSYLENIYYI